MAEARSNMQLPLGAFAAKSVVQAEIEAFQEGIELGRQVAHVAAPPAGMGPARLPPAYEIESCSPSPPSS